MEPKKPSLGQRWTEARPTKTAVFWACVGCIVATLIVGFTWGGWVRGATAKSMVRRWRRKRWPSAWHPCGRRRSAEAPGRTEDQGAERDMSSYERGEYVKAQGWAKMPGDTDTDAKVAEQCARLVTEQKS